MTMTKEERNVTGKCVAHYLAEKIEAARSDPRLESEVAETKKAQATHLWKKPSLLNSGEGNLMNMRASRYLDKFLREHNETANEDMRVR